MRYIGIDMGMSRVGIAYSDEQGKFAYPLRVVNFKEHIEEIKKAAEEQNTKTIIIGESISTNGQENELMEQIRKTRNILEKLGYKVIYEMEIYSTLEAKRYGGDDSSAAAIILQSFLDKG